ncbi:MAG: hypothetical protein JHD35_16340, partial [Sphingopyxis sp.]|nr:hypothetical protein [Sphingopyxis sp.]
DAGVVKPVPGPAATATWLDHDEIISASVIRTSDSVAMTEGTHYTLDRARGVITNLTANAMTLTYSGSRARKDVLSVNPNTSALTLTDGTESKRNADDWAPELPSGQVELGRILRKGNRTIYIPRHRWRNGVHVDRKADYLAALEYNRQILAPIIRRLKAGQRVRVIAAGNSWAAMGAGGNPALLNVNHSSFRGANGSLSWLRDAPTTNDFGTGYFERYDDATLARHGLNAAARLEWGSTDVGYNLTPDVAKDGHGAVHGRAGYVWAMLAEWHRTWPSAVIEYHNWGVPGTNSGTGALGNGSMNLLNPTRRDAILADIVAGETIVIPVDPMNELGSTASYSNWRSFAGLAQAAGAVVHFMGAARPDPRVGAGADAVALSVQDMCRAAWDSGSAISDAWRILSPANLCGIGLHDEEMMAANLINHGSIRLMREIGRDAAQSYTGA